MGHIDHVAASVRRTVRVEAKVRTEYLIGVQVGADSVKHPALQEAHVQPLSGLHVHGIAGEVAHASRDPPIERDLAAVGLEVDIP